METWNINIELKDLLFFNDVPSFHEPADSQLVEESLVLSDLKLLQKANKVSILVPILNAENTYNFQEFDNNRSNLE